MYTEIKKCRICGNTDLVSILHLGDQYLTGVFPKTKEETITSGPIELLKCQEDKKGNFCGLLQLRQSYDLNEMYGVNYGYRSSLNRSMVEHLRSKVNSLCQRIALNKDDVVVDIGSSDGTMLSFYPRDAQVLIGFDPSAEKFRKCYRGDIHLITDFFSAKNYREKFGNETKAKIVTSIAMFYDLENPIEFMQQIETILAEDGIWHFEQSYLPSMLEQNAYDTICHEHLEYYAVKQIKWMTDRAGLKILDIKLNAINGGSFAVTTAKQCAPYPENNKIIDKFLEQEQRIGLDTLTPYIAFKERIFQHRSDLVKKLRQIRNDGKMIVGYGASTKGNVLLQFCGLDETLISCIAEVNKNKFGCFTVGTNIPIVSESEAKVLNPDYLFVLPWHFKKNIIERESEYLNNGGKLLFPLPKIEEVEK
ncbi:MAG: class I SAM-dependent methyltransferase [bacterium]